MVRILASLSLVMSDAPMPVEVRRGVETFIRHTMILELINRQDLGSASLWTVSMERLRSRLYIRLHRQRGAVRQPWYRCNTDSVQDTKNDDG
jgi:hypothetical protein